MCAWLQTNKCDTTEKVQCTADCKKENGADYEGFIIATDKTLSDTSLYDACCENRCVCRRIPDDCKSYKCFWADETTCTGKGGKVVTLALPNPSSATMEMKCCGIQRCEIPIPPIAPVDPIIIPTRPPVTSPNPTRSPSPITTTSTTTSTSTLAPVTTTLPGKCVAWLQTNKCDTTEKVQCTADCKKENGADYEGFIIATDKTLSDTSLYDACCENRCVCRRIPDDCKSYKCFWADETTCTGKGGKVVTLALPNPSSATMEMKCCGIQRCEIPIPPIAPVDPIIIPTRPPVTTSSTTTSTSTLAPVTTTLPGKCVAWLQTNKCDTTEKVQCTADCKKENGADYEGFIRATDKTLSDTSLYDACCENRCVCRRIPDDCKSYKCFWADETTCTGKGGKVVTLALPNPSSATMEMKCCGIQRCEIPIPPIAPVDPIIIPTRPPVTTPTSTTTSTSTLAPVTTTLPGKCVAWLQTNKCDTTEKVQCTADCKKENGADYEGFIIATDKTLSDTSLYDACCENRCVCRRIPDDCKSYKCFWADETTCTGKGGKVVTLALPNPSSATMEMKCCGIQRCEIPIPAPVTNNTNKT